ncbi:hypothetical protein D9623_33770 (plasmid) [Azospirillum brasilense]|uniref:DNA cytosine methyltransferase n=2 Tax=root TaxID=1 RepID=A0A4D8QWD1_AZOBR|nr:MULTISPECIES: hypothetical protein [Azospirillum]MDW7555409.1 hypothetical protein [Azospirillum brasilense]MDW7595183.1 hypothetical protein [Azospirillum brasilense]MDW7630336.1 hypothetical protein [Azospirillum brasilense]MDX5949704.1 hypothetical protein [Azospirillum brasilense]QCO12873.1 hypothetical protein D3868_28095 [Azospirillum brasilense]
MVRPWIEAGYHAITVDLQPAAAMSGRTHIRADLTALHEDFAAQYEPAAVFAFPPCTDLANSGARWFRDKGLAGLIGALRLVEQARLICEASGGPWMLENPMGQLSTYWRQPDHKFNPCDYAGYSPDPDEDSYTKLTCLWTGNGFRMPLPDRRPAAKGSKMHLLPPGDDRADLRSVTPLGFAYAVFAANRARPATPIAAE